MKRQIVYYGALPQDTDLLNTQKNSYVAMAKLAAAILGTNTIFSGLAATPGSGLNVSIAAGQVFSLQNIDNAVYGSIAADTSHQILKQGINLDATTLSVPAPGSSGQSINYLVQAQFQEVDGGAQVLPYYNSANPTVALSGQNNNGQSQATYRDNIVALQVKAGAAATTGSQTTPAADSGWTGLYVVTVNYGDTSIAQAAINTVSGAPFLTNQLYNFANGLNVGGALTGTSATFSGALRAASLDYTPIGQDSPAAIGGTTIRATGVTAPSSGQGMEVYYSGGKGYVTAFDRTANAYLPAVIQGSSLTLIANGGTATVQGNLSANNIDSTPIGQATPAAGSFTSVAATVSYASNSVGLFHNTDTGANSNAVYGRVANDSAYNFGGVNAAGSSYTFIVTGAGNLYAAGGIDNTPIGQATAAAGKFTTSTVTAGYVAPAAGQGISAATNTVGGFFYGSGSSYDAVLGNKNGQGAVSIYTGTQRVAIGNASADSGETLQNYGTAKFTGSVGIGGSYASTAGLYLSGSPMAGTTQYGLDNNVQFSSAATNQAYGYLSALSTAAASFSISSLFHFAIADFSKGSGSSVNTQYGLYVSPLANAVTNWAVYTAGSTPSYFGGNVQAVGGIDNSPIGQTTPSSGRFTHVDVEGGYANNSAGLFYNSDTGSSSHSVYARVANNAAYNFGGVNAAGSSYTFFVTGAGNLYAAGGIDNTVIGQTTQAAGSFTTGSFSSNLNSAATIRATGTNAPTGGQGVEMYYTGGNGYVTAYDRTAGAYLPVVLQGSTVTLTPSGGAATVNGTLTANAGTSGNQVVNFSQFGSSKASNGYAKRPDGLIEQWGVIDITTVTTPGGQGTVTFPIAFPAACTSFTANMASNGYQSGVTGCYTYVNSTAQGTITLDNATGSETAGTYPVYWRAIGY